MNIYVHGHQQPLNLVPKKRIKSNFDRLKSKIDLNKEWIFLLLKLFNCILITLAYFGFTYGKLPQIIDEFKNAAPIHKLVLFQSKLFILELLFWIIPFLMFFLWFKSDLIKFKFSKILFLCSIFSFLISLTDLGFGSSYGLLIVLRISISVILSMAYWTNLLELLAISERRHLILIVIYFLITALSNICSSLAFFIPFYFYYSGIGLAFLILNIVNRLFIFKFIRGEFDFSVIDIALRGVKTSLAFFEIILMSSIVHMNFGHFFASVNLQKFKLIGKIDDKYELPYFWNFFNTDTDKISFDGYYNSCTLGLAFGFSLMTIFNAIRVKKQILSIITKIVFIFYVLIIIRKDNFSGLKNSILNIIFYSSIAINFSIKLNDIIKGFKRFTELSEMPIELSLIFLKSFNLSIIGFFIGFIIAFFTQIIILITGNKINETSVAIGQAAFIVLLITWLFESNVNDNFLIIKRIECEGCVEEQITTNANNVQSNVDLLNNNNNNFNNNQDRQKNEKFSRKGNRSTFSNENHSRTNYDNRSNNDKPYYTNDDANLFNNTSLDLNQPSAPTLPTIFDNNDNSNTNCFGSNSFANNRSSDFGNGRSNQSSGNERRRNQGSGERRRNYDKSRNYDNNSNNNQDNSRFDNNSNNDQDNSNQQSTSNATVTTNKEAGDWE